MNDTAKQLRNENGELIEAYYFTLEEVEAIKRALNTLALEYGQTAKNNNNDKIAFNYFNDQHYKTTKLFCKFVK